MVSEIDISRLHITKQNIAVEKVLANTDNPRHHYLLQSYVTIQVPSGGGGGW